MTATTDHTIALPQTKRLDRRAQLRLLAIAAALIVAIFIVIAIIGAATKPAEPVTEKTPPGAFAPTKEQLAGMKLTVVRDGSTMGGIQATGTIAVNGDSSTPILLPFSGQVAAVFVQAGQKVTRGQPLLRIASPDFVEARDQFLTASAQRATAAAQVRIAQDTATRQAAIYQTAGGALKDYRQAQSDLVTAQSALRSADAALAATRDKLSLLGKGATEIRGLQTGGDSISAQTVYRAPASGVVATRDVAPGQYVTAGGDKPIMTIADASRVWLIAQLAEGDAASVHLGDRARVTTPAYPGRVFDAVIDNVGAALDPATHRLPVRATVRNDDGALKPQMFASFTIERRSGAPTGIYVPSDAVIHEGDKAVVWVAGPKGYLYARPVQVADSTDGVDHIVAGLKAGDRIVTSGALFVNEAGL
ncbi:efflux RND transporter periplasmic adaptor subunit [Sphingomonas sp. TREG-RG-20F-R18-01]|uniref:efflux RND transporter periplasmic adaptor subunit n=1 Tax=Sphingomonas sp. TREG-RG-20F-R18-01 TaxID=2914982 RepID=UPI001F587B0B|nr:efflux RND transporter periplasmic adaptor subunit [Sphingomonas sp. TREG-RG-20F-R18-01]